MSTTYYNHWPQPDPVAALAGSARVTKEREALPSAATANDLRELALLLRGRPGGVSVAESGEGGKRRTLSRDKLAAYEDWGLVVIEGGRLKLSGLGLALARGIESEIEVFRQILGQAEPYHVALELIRRRRASVVTTNEVADFWRASLPPAGDDALKGAALSFLHLCQAAGLGSLMLGKRGHNTRLYVDQGELQIFLDEPPPTEPHAKASPLRERGGAEQGVGAGPDAAHAPAEPRRVYILTAGRTGVLEVIEAALGLACIDFKTVEAAGEHGADFGRLAGAGGCQSCIVLMHGDRAGRDQDDRDEFLLRAGAAAATFGVRLALVCPKGLTIPCFLQTLRRYEIDGDTLDWETGIEILRFVKAAAISPA